MNTSAEIILASQSPRRRQLLNEYGYAFRVVTPSDGAECGMCSRETAAEMVARLALQKAKDVAQREPIGLILGCDTVAECCGQILGKPHNREHAQQMLQLMSGRIHSVYSGLCLWWRPDHDPLVRVDVTRLEMDELSPTQLEEYLETDQWIGKAGAFGYQDGLDWVHIREGSESNVVGLPMELLDRMLIDLAADAFRPIRE